MDGFQDFLSTSSAQIPVLSYLINLILAAVLSFVLGKVYVQYGTTLSNRERFARTFIMLAVTTTLIITIVKSSLALSPGLVGALSIVRFRAAIKEPEELTYLFLVIAIGLGMGANQPLITLIGFLLAIVIIGVLSIGKPVEEKQNLFLNIVDQDAHKVNLAAVMPILEKYCSSVNLRRLDESRENLEASLLVEIDNFKVLNEAKEELLKLSSSMRVVFLENKGIS